MKLKIINRIELDHDEVRELFDPFLSLHGPTAQVIYAKIRDGGLVIEVEVEG